AKIGNLKKKKKKITPAVNAVSEPKDASLRNSKNAEFVDTVAEKNVQLTIDRIHAESPILTEMEKNGEIMIIGAMYDINTGEVKFFE
ncbi:MAG: carbonic anhydrase, partial [Gelidibacter sp.]|nr:carbonic anhydrase [Gelidibacter sp.]